MSGAPAYPRRLRALHWAMALGLPLQGLLGWVAENSRDRALVDVAMQAHMQVGALLMVLLAVRIGVRWRLPRNVVGDGGGLAQRAAVALHRLLYLLMLALPLSGIVIFVHMQTALELLGVFTLPPLLASVPEDERVRALAWYLHVYGAWALLALVGVHVAAALWHQFVRGDRLISHRMGFRREEIG